MTSITLGSFPRDAKRLRALLLATIGPLIVGCVASVLPELTLAATLAVIGGAAIATRPLVRLTFVVFGGLLVLGPSEVTLAKVVYFQGALLCVAFAVPAMGRQWSVLPRPVQVLVWSSAVALTLLGLVAAFRALSGTDPASILRDLLPYGLLAMAPAFAIDLGVHVSIGRLQLVAAAGLAFGSLGFLLSWTVRRGIGPDANLPWRSAGSSCRSPF